MTGISRHLDHSPYGVDHDGVDNGNRQSLLSTA
jgi:hypothetical protein